MPYVTDPDARPLDEDCISSAPILIFPNISSCIAIVLQDAAFNIAGYHATVPTEAQYMEISLRYATRLLPLGRPQRVFCIGMLQRWAGLPDRKRYPTGLRMLIENNTGCGQIYGHDLTALESTFPKTGTKAAVVKAYTKDKAESGATLRFRFGGPAAYDLAAQAMHMSGIYKIRSVLLSRTEIAQRLDVAPQPYATSTGTDDAAMTKLRPEDLGRL